MAINEEGRPLPDELKIDNIKNWEQMFQMMDDVERWKDWEEIPDEDLWQDGEIGARKLSEIIFQRVINIGDWKLIRRKNG